MSLQHLVVVYSEDETVRVCQKVEVGLAFLGCIWHTKAWTWASHWRIEKTLASFTLHWHSVCFLKSCPVIEPGWRGKVCACLGHKKQENLSLRRELCSCFSPDTSDLLPGDFSHRFPSSLPYTCLHIKLCLRKHMLMFPLNFSLYTKNIDQFCLSLTSFVYNQLNMQWERDTSLNVFFLKQTPPADKIANQC